MENLNLVTPDEINQLIDKLNNRVDTLNWLDNEFDSDDLSDYYNELHKLKGSQKYKITGDYLGFQLSTDQSCAILIWVNIYSSNHDFSEKSPFLLMYLNLDTSEFEDESPASSAYWNNLLAEHIEEDYKI